MGLFDFVGDILGIGDAPEADPNIGIAAGRQMDLAEKTYADSQALFAEFKPLLMDKLKGEISAQATSNTRSDDAWADYNKTWKPIEGELAARSLGWASEGRLDQRAAEAASGVASEYDAARSSSREDMQRAGLDPTSIATMESAGRLSEAKAKAGASNTTRREVEKEGMAYLDNAARFGRNMTSTGLAAASLATQQGQGANSSMNNLAFNSQAGASAASGMYGQAANTYTGLFNAQNTSYNNQLDFAGDIIGAGTTLYGMKSPASKGP